MNKTIWMCWFQGECDKKMPKLNRECIKKWKELNSDCTVNILSDETISEYIPEYFDIDAKSKINHPIQKKANLVRMLLLSKYGGTWADCTLYPVKSLKSFYSDVMNDVGFFTYRFIPCSFSNGQCRQTVNWFLMADKPKNYLIESWKNAYIDFYIKTNEWKYYHQMHMLLCELYNTDTKVRYIIDNMVQISEEIPHSARIGRDMQPSFVYKKPDIECIKK